MQKYEIRTLYSKPEDIFLIKYRSLSRVIINGVRNFGSNKTQYSIKDSLENFYYSIADHSDKCWFAVPDYNMSPEIDLMIRIFKELHLCTIILILTL